MEENESLQYEEAAGTVTQTIVAVLHPTELQEQEVELAGPGNGLETYTILQASDVYTEEAPTNVIETYTETLENPLETLQAVVVDTTVTTTTQLPSDDTSDQPDPQSVAFRQNLEARILKPENRKKWMEMLQTKGFVICTVPGCHMKYSTVESFEKHYKWCTGDKGMGVENCPYCENQFLATDDGILSHISEFHPDDIEDYQVKRGERLAAAITRLVINEEAKRQAERAAKKERMAKRAQQLAEDGTVSDLGEEELLEEDETGKRPRQKRKDKKGNDEKSQVQQRKPKKPRDPDLSGRLKKVCDPVVSMSRNWSVPRKTYSRNPFSPGVTQGERRSQSTDAETESELEKSQCDVLADSTDNLQLKVSDDNSTTIGTSFLPNSILKNMGLRSEAEYSEDEEDVDGNLLRHQPEEDKKDKRADKKEDKAGQKVQFKMATTCMETQTDEFDAEDNAQNNTLNKIDLTEDAVGDKEKPERRMVYVVQSNKGATTNFLTKGKKMTVLKAVINEGSDLNSRGQPIHAVFKRAHPVDESSQSDTASPEAKRSRIVIKATAAPSVISSSEASLAAAKQVKQTSTKKNESLPDNISSRTNNVTTASTIPLEDEYEDEPDSEQYTRTIPAFIFSSSNVPIQLCGERDSSTAFRGRPPMFSYGTRGGGRPRGRGRGRGRLQTRPPAITNEPIVLYDSPQIPSRGRKPRGRPPGRGGTGRGSVSVIDITHSSNSTDMTSTPVHTEPTLEPQEDGSNAHNSKAVYLEEMETVENEVEVVTSSGEVVPSDDHASVNRGPVKKASQKTKIPSNEDIALPEAKEITISSAGKVIPAIPMDIHVDDEDNIENDETEYGVVQFSGANIISAQTKGQESGELVISSVSDIQISPAEEIVISSAGRRNAVKGKKVAAPVVQTKAVSSTKPKPQPEQKTSEEKLIVSRANKVPSQVSKTISSPVNKMPATPIVKVAVSSSTNNSSTPTTKLLVIPARKAVTEVKPGETTSNTIIATKAHKTLPSNKEGDKRYTVEQEFMAIQAELDDSETTSQKETSKKSSASEVKHSENKNLSETNPESKKKAGELDMQEDQQRTHEDSKNSKNAAELKKLGQKNKTNKTLLSETKVSAKDDKRSSEVMDTEDENSKLSTEGSEKSAPGNVDMKLRRSLRSKRDGSNSPHTVLENKQADNQSKKVEGKSNTDDKEKAAQESKSSYSGENISLKRRMLRRHQEDSAEQNSDVILGALDADTNLAEVKNVEPDVDSENLVVKSGADKVQVEKEYGLRTRKSLEDTNKGSAERKQVSRNLKNIHASDDDLSTEASQASSDKSSSDKTTKKNVTTSNVGLSEAETSETPVVGRRGRRKLQKKESDDTPSPGVGKPDKEQVSAEDKTETETPGTKRRGRLPKKRVYSPEPVPVKKDSLDSIAASRILASLRRSSGIIDIEPSPVPSDKGHVSKQSAEASEKAPIQASDNAFVTTEETVATTEETVASTEETVATTEQAMATTEETVETTEETVETTEETEGTTEETEGTTEETVATTEETVATTEETVATTEETVATTEETVATTEETVATTEETVSAIEGTDVTEETVMTTEETVMTTEETVMTTEEAVMTTEEAVMTTEEAVMTTEEAVMTTEEAVMTTEEAVMTTEETVMTTEETVVTTEETVVTTDETVATIEGTLGTTEETVASTEETLGTIEETLVTVEETLASIEETVVTTEETVVTTEEPVVTTEETTMTTEEVVADESVMTENIIMEDGVVTLNNNVIEDECVTMNEVLIGTEETAEINQEVLEANEEVLETTEVPYATTEDVLATQQTFLTTDGTYVTTGGAFSSTEGAFVTDGVAFAADGTAFMTAEEAFGTTGEVSVTTEGAFATTGQTFVSNDEAFETGEEAPIITELANMNVMHVSNEIIPITVENPANYQVTLASAGLIAAISEMEVETVDTSIMTEDEFLLETDRALASIQKSPDTTIVQNTIPDTSAMPNETSTPTPVRRGRGRPPKNTYNLQSATPALAGPKYASTPIASAVPDLPDEFQLSDASIKKRKRQTDLSRREINMHTRECEEGLPDSEESEEEYEEEEHYQPQIDYRYKSPGRGRRGRGGRGSNRMFPLRAPRHGKTKKGYFKCSGCNVVFDIYTNARNHILSAHNGLANINDSSPIPENEVYMRLKAALRIRKYLVCHKDNCGKTFRSLMGYINHAKDCGKEAAYTTCDVCGKQLRSTGFYLHRRRHMAQERELQRLMGNFDSSVDSADLNVSPVVIDDNPPKRRKAAIAAKTRMKEFVRENTDEGVEDIQDDGEISDPNDKAYTAVKSDDGEKSEAYSELEELDDGEELVPGERKFNTRLRELESFFQYPNKVGSLSKQTNDMWTQELQTTGKIICKLEGCKKEFFSNVAMFYHWQRCQVSSLWTCRKCSGNYTHKTAYGMYRHIINEHFQEIPDTVTFKRKLAASQKAKFQRTSGKDFAVSPLKPVTSLNIPHQALMFCQRHYVREVFPHWRPRKKHWRSITSMSHLYPLPFKESVAFRVEMNGMPSTNAIKLKLYESTPPKEQVDHLTINVGGPVWSSAWCPTPYYRRAMQYVAIGVGLDPNKEHLISDTAAHKGILQLWRIGHITRNSMEGRPRLMLSMAHDFGVLWGMCWCPSGAWDDPCLDPFSPNIMNRLGLIALACGDGSARILTLPHPNESHRPELYSAFPIVVLSPPDAGSTVTAWSSSCTAVSWQRTAGHTTLLAGYGNGCVCQFDLMARSPLLVVSTYPIVMRPFMMFNAHSSAVTSLVFAPNGDSRFMASSGLDRLCCIWDLQDTSTPLHVRQKGLVRDLAWTSHWCGYFGAQDDCYNLFLSHSFYKECGYHNYPKRPLSSHGACTWSISVSEWLNVEASCDAAGEVVMMGLPELEYSLDTIKGLVNSRMPVYRIELEPIPKDGGIDYHQLPQVSSEDTTLPSHQNPASMEEQLTWNQPEDPLFDSCADISENRIDASGYGEQQRTERECESDSNHSGVPDGEDKEDSMQKDLASCKTYEDITSKYRLVIKEAPVRNIHTTDRASLKRLSLPQTMNHLIPGQYMLASVNTVSWNPNPGSHWWLFSAGQAGLARLTCVSSLSQPVFEKELETLQFAKSTT